MMRVDPQQDRKLMYPYSWRDLLAFMAGFLPFAGTSIAGVILAGWGWTLLVWLAYSLAFFVGWEARVLCSHCPYWAAEGRILRCPANHGVLKLWRYRPGPMSRGEGIQFLVGAGLLVALPLVPMAVGGQWLFFGLSLLNAACFGYGLWHHVCGRCVNFSCPANHVPKHLVDAFLRAHPVMRRAWEEAGYVLDEPEQVE